MEEYNYDTLVDSTTIEDISSDEINRGIFRSLKGNSEDFNVLWICDDRCSNEKYQFVSMDLEEIGWLGYFIGKNTSVKWLVFDGTAIPPHSGTFCRGLNMNNTLQKISFRGTDLLNGQVLRMMDAFFKNNHNLTEIEVCDCELGTEDARQLSLTLGGCTKSLKHILLADCQMGDGQLVDIILALSMHPQLEQLYLLRMNIGRNECIALATLLHNTTKQLQSLSLRENNIDDEGVDALINAMSGIKLRCITLSGNQITAKGWKKVSTLLEMPDCNLEEIRNGIGNDGAHFFADVLRGNCKVKKMILDSTGISKDGWTNFSTLLCDTSSVNNTYCSNHTLLDLGLSGCFGWVVPADVRSYLDLNGSSEDKGQVAMTKILQHHSHFKVQAFFQWEFKVLPLIINWLENAADCTTEFDEQISKMKLSCMYDFVREFPMLYIEPVTRKEIEKCSAMEMKMEGDPLQEARFEQVQKCKIRAMRRLL